MDKTKKHLYTPYIKETRSFPAKITTLTVTDVTDTTAKVNFTAPAALYYEVKVNGRHMYNVTSSGQILTGLPSGTNVISIRSIDTFRIGSKEWSNEVSVTMSIGFFEFTVVASQFTIPTSGGGYSYKVEDWGDGTSSASGRTGNTSKTYASLGTYKIKISGTFPRIHFNNGAEKLKITRIDKRGIYGVGELNQNNAFYRCENLSFISDDFWAYFDTFKSAVLTFAYVNISTMPIFVKFPNLEAGNNMFTGVTFSTSRYSQLLIDMESVNSVLVNFHAGNSKYNSSAVSARNALVSRGATIVDGGLI